MLGMRCFKCASLICSSSLRLFRNLVFFSKDATKFVWFYDSVLLVASLECATKFRRCAWLSCELDRRLLGWLTRQEACWSWLGHTRLSRLCSVCFLLIEHMVLLWQTVSLSLIWYHFGVAKHAWLEGELLLMLLQALSEQACSPRATKHWRRLGYVTQLGACQLAVVIIAQISNHV